MKTEPTNEKDNESNYDERPSAVKKSKQSANKNGKNFLEMNRNIKTLKDL